MIPDYGGLFDDDGDHDALCAAVTAQVRARAARPQVPLRQWRFTAARVAVVALALFAVSGVVGWWLVGTGRVG